MATMFHVGVNPNGESEPLYKRADVALDAGVTVLVGSNGSGKTTLLNRVRAAAETMGWAAHGVDARARTVREVAAAAAWSPDPTLFPQALGLAFSSEGQQIAAILEDSCRTIGGLAKRAGETPFLLTVDAIDSGLDTAEIGMFLDSCRWIIRRRGGAPTIVLVASNTFTPVDWANRNDGTTLSVRDLKPVTLPDWPAWRDWVERDSELKYRRIRRMASERRPA
ncbi:P-loop NTPase family protein [Bifidobacterium myosotis]|uniref:AAA+ ATPase domain-containing protein n=1 Tax=Bifidobacterium myosotis TaxID=1630166 RepID=A0A5M9ZL17_9BIFI|nr:hypothetical protein [Bifidobacterium myosotis]KAA8828129.1 hypothetical protein EMO91_06725 [Bifidobacterium myosotis]